MIRYRVFSGNLFQRTRIAVALMVVLSVTLIFLPLVSASNASVTLVTTPFITIDPIGNHTVGDVFFINGTTNLPPSEKLDLLIQTTIFKPGPKSDTGYRPGAFLSDIPIISKSSGINRWSVNITDIAINELPSGWSPYVVTVISKENSSISAQQEFDLMLATNLTTSPIFPTTVQKPSPIQLTTNSITIPPATRSSSLPLVLPIMGITATMILNFIRKNKDD